MTIYTWGGGYIGLLSFHRCSSQGVTSRPPCPSHHKSERRIKAKISQNCSPIRDMNPALVCTDVLRITNSASFSSEEIHSSSCYQPAHCSCPGKQRSEGTKGHWLAGATEQRAESLTSEEEAAGFITEFQTTSAVLVLQTTHHDIHWCHR